MPYYTFRNPWDFDRDTVSQSITLYAKWEELDRPLVLTDSIDGAAAPPEVPEVEGFTFSGWYTSPNGYQNWYRSNRVQADTTVYAKWKSTTPQVSADIPGQSQVSQVTFASAMLPAGAPPNNLPALCMAKRRNRYNRRIP